MRRCGNKNCPLPQPLKESQFNKNKYGKDGLQNYCRTCQSISNAKGRQKFPEANKMKQRRNRLKNIDRWRALRRIRMAVAAGKLERGVCEVCGHDRVEAFIEEPFEEYCHPWHKAPKIRWYCHGHHPRRSSADNTITYEEFDVEDD